MNAGSAALDLGSDLTTDVFPTGKVQNVAAAKPTSVFDTAVKQYPIIERSGVIGVMTPKKDSNNMLEFYPPGESERPSSIPLDRPGVEIFNERATPLDVLGDVVSHYLVKTDPVVSGYYEQFKKSMSPQQLYLLHEQYQYARKNEGEVRPFEQWLEIAGLPAYFRGYPFKQWPDDFNERAYTPQQRNMLDEMMKYLSSEQVK